MPLALTRYFDYFGLLRYNQRLYFSYPVASGSMGGVYLDMRWDSWKEDALEYDSNYAIDPYKTIQGSFDFIIKGPTSSGIGYFAQLIQDNALSARDFYEDRSLLPVKLFARNNFYDIKAELVDAKVDFSQEEILDSHHVLFGTFSYTRKAILTDTAEDDNNGLTTKAFQPKIIKTLPNRTPEPTNLGVVFSAFDYVPSGYLLVANTPIIAISGYLFGSGAAAGNPVGVKLYNENANNSFSVYTSGLVDGTFGWTPQAANTDVYTSGIFTVASFSQQEYTSDMDIYATVKTTFSGTKFYLSALFTNPINTVGQEQTATKEVLIQNLPDPTIIYLGKVSANGNLYLSNPQLKLRADTASGTLLIDSVICHPLNDPIVSSTIFFPRTKITPLYTTNIAKVFTLYVKSNYNPLTDAGLVPNRLQYPTLKAYWQISSPLKRGSYAIPYRGNISIFRRVDDLTYFQRYITTRKYGLWWGMVIATGSTSSTINQWVATSSGSSSTQFGWVSSLRNIVGSRWTMLEESGFTYE